MMDEGGILTFWARLARRSNPSCKEEVDGTGVRALKVTHRPYILALGHPLLFSQFCKGWFY